MGALSYSSRERPRELRRRVVLPARLRSGAQWSDACILNISSRGMMIHSGRAAQKGSLIELRRGDHVIVARVMWRDGARVGLQSDDRLPVEQIMSLGQSRALQLTAGAPTPVERRTQRRAAQADARLRGRVMEFIAVTAIAATLATGAWSMTQAAFARPLAKIAAALAG